MRIRRGEDLDLFCPSAYEQILGWFRGKAALWFLYRSELLSITSACEMAFLQPGRGRKEGAVRWRVPYSPSVHFPADTPENTPWRKSAPFPPRGPPGHSPGRCKAGASGWSLVGPQAALLVLSRCLWRCPVRKPTWLCLMCHFSILLPCSVPFQAPFLPNSVFILSTFAASSHISITCLLTGHLLSSFYPIPHFHLPSKG